MGEELKEILRLIGGIEAICDQLGEQILFNLRNMSVEQLKAELRDDPPDVLKYVYDMALQAEQFEICAAVKHLQKHVSVKINSQSG